jgi:hypothetical protein
LRRTSGSGNPSKGAPHINVENTVNYPPRKGRACKSSVVQPKHFKCYDNLAITPCNSMRRASFSNPGSVESFHAAIKGTPRRRLSEQTILSLARGGSPPHYRLPPRWWVTTKWGLGLGGSRRYLQRYYF